jgi:RNA polymerase sigma-70 factor (ECF subfamily)
MSERSLQTWEFDAIARETNWVHRAKIGDSQAVACLIDKHRVSLTAMIANIVRDGHEAEDIAQEALLKAIREIGRLRDDTAFKRFLYRIAVHATMDRMRKKRPQVGLPEMEMTGLDADIESKLQIERTLAKLPPDLRTTLVLREVQQLDYDEIADILMIPVGTVRSRLHAAREKFRQLWTERGK